MGVLTAAQKKQLENYVPELILLTECFVEKWKNKRNGNKRQDEKVPGPTQFSGLVAAGQQAACVEELKLFIRYKEVKQGTSKEWAGLAKPLIEIIDKVCIMAPSEEFQLPLVQRFFGYLMWNVRASGGGK